MISQQFKHRLAAALCGFALLAAAEPALSAGQPPPPAKPKRITVSVLGMGDTYVDLKGQAAVDFMIERLKKEIDLALPDKPDLIVLPEACDRFAAMDRPAKAEYYRVRGDQILDFLRKVAADNHCYIVYSAGRTMPDGTGRNSSQLIGRDGKVVGIYNKNYPVPAETTEGGTLCGKDAPVFETDFGRVAMAICFDLNFQELLERYAAQKPDLIIFSTRYHGGLMQGFWAYRARAHFIGCCSIAESTVVNPLGQTIGRSTNYFNRVTATINLDCKVIHYDGNVGKLRAVKAKYGPGVTILDPGHLGSVLLTSELPDVSAADMVKEFGIETWDEYYERSMKHRQLPGHMEP